MRFRGLGVVGVTLGVVGCGELLGLDGLKDRPDGGADVDVPEVDASDAADPCALAHVPPRPAADDPSDASVLVINAVRSIDFGQRADGSAPLSFGYDLDGIDTCCANAPESCQPVTSGATHCDEEGGRDNAGGQLLQVMAQYGVTAANQDQINDTIDGGNGSLLLVVKGYNGQPNDTQVTVALYSSTGLTLDADGGLPPAKWDGTDSWRIDPASILDVPDGGLPIPVQFDSNAYVANGVLVTLLDFPLVLGNIIATVVVSGGVMTGRLVPQGNTFRLDDGQGAGRMKTTNILKLLLQLQNPVGPGFICPNTVPYDTAKSIMCQHADIMSDKSFDNSGATCDALAVAFGFNAVPALIGPVDTGDASKPVSDCLDAGVDNCP